MEQLPQMETVIQDSIVQQEQPQVSQQQTIVQRDIIVQPEVLIKCHVRVLNIKTLQCNPPAFSVPLAHTAKMG